jgi:hypothetical protein
MCSSIVFELVEEKKDRKNQKFLQPPYSTKTHVYFALMIAAIGLKVNLFPTVKSL